MAAARPINPPDDDLISLDQARLRYKVSRTTLFARLANHDLTRYRRHGDRRTLIDRVEADNYFAAYTP